MFGDNFAKQIHHAKKTSRIGLTEAAYAKYDSTRNRRATILIRVDDLTKASKVAHASILWGEDNV